MPGFSSIQVKVPALALDGYIDLTVGTNTYRITYAHLRNLSLGFGYDVGILFRQIAIDLSLAGIDMDDPEAVRKFIESRTYYERQPEGA